MMQTLRNSLSVILLATIPFAAAAAGEKSLARLGILMYEDETGTKNFGYMPGSLTEAIDKSLQKKFEYVREEPADSEGNRRAIRATGLFEPKDAAVYCSKNNVQILIFGKFSFDAASKQLIVTTYISLGTDKFRTLKERRNAADATIFSLADRVADDIVAEMTLIAKEQRAAGKGGDGASGGKTELAKVVEINWAFKNYHVYGGLGAATPLGDIRNTLQSGLALSVSGKYLFWRGLYGSLNAHIFGAKFKDSSLGEKTFTAFPILAAVGYAFVFGNDRWRWDIDVGAGFASYQTKVNEVIVPDSSQGGSALRATTSLSWMLTEKISLLSELALVQLNGTDSGAVRFATLTLGVGYAYY